MLRIVTWFHLEFLNAWPYSVDRRDYGIWSLSDLTDFWFLMKWNINGKYQRAKSKFTKVFFNSWNRLKWHFQRFDSFLDVRPNEYKNCTIENFDRIYRENKKMETWYKYDLGSLRWNWKFREKHGKCRIPNFCYIQAIAFDLRYLPVAVVGT